MNVNERNIAVRTNPLSPSKLQSGAGDLSSAEMPEVIVVPDFQEPIGNIPAPLTLADVEGGELKPIPIKPSKQSQPESNRDPEIFQVRFKTLDGKLNLLFPNENKTSITLDKVTNADQAVTSASKDGNDITSATPFFVLTWQELLAQLEQRMAASGHDWKPRTQVYLQAGDRLLDTRQLQELSESLQNHQLLLHCVVTNRRQTAINAASMGFCVEQGTIFGEILGFNPIPDAPLDDPLYIKATVRSGTEIRHSGSIIIFGDVNAGAEIISEGDIIVWGKLKGMAHAGLKGNAQAVVMALHLEATQIRIANLIARVESPSTYFCPEVAFVNTQGVPAIQIVQAVDYSKK
ncbi:MAG: septum site-determining protein MinC [Pseudanabaena sp.]|jgi:septum site-determining protein MinC|uniref:septum site-determining protein MinC n=1 Tax=Pseudanabaena mucicola TaxID=71190 RepID=UPI0025787A2E|nr:septum site-determining protein MinC [Pseudanabaena mucicola]